MPGLEPAPEVQVRQGLRAAAQGGANASSCWRHASCTCASGSNRQRGPCHRVRAGRSSLCNCNATPHGRPQLQCRAAAGASAAAALHWLPFVSPTRCHLHTNITCCQRSHFTRRCSCPTSSKRSRAPRLRWRCRTTAYRRPRWSRCLYRSSIRRDAWPEKKIELQPCCNMHIHTYTHTSTFTYTHPLLRSRNHAQSRLVQTPAAATPALARGLHALRPRLHGSIKKSRNTHSEPPAPPPLIATFYFNQCIRIQALGFRV